MISKIITGFCYTWLGLITLAIIILLISALIQAPAFVLLMLGYLLFAAVTIFSVIWIGTRK